MGATGMKQGWTGSGRRKASGGRGSLETLRSRVRQTRHESLPPYRMRRRATNPMEDGRRSSRLGATRAGEQAISGACASTGTMRGRPSTRSPKPARQGGEGSDRQRWREDGPLSRQPRGCRGRGIESRDAGHVEAVPRSKGARRAPRRRRRGRGSHLVAVKASDELHASQDLPGSPGRGLVDVVLRARSERSSRSRERSPANPSRHRHPPTNTRQAESLSPRAMMPG